MNEKETAILEEFSGVSAFSLPKLPYFKQVEMDSCGNYHLIKPGSQEKIQIIFRITPNGVLPGEKTEEGYDAVILGDGKQMEDELLYFKDSPIGILRSGKDEHWYLEKLSDEDEDLTQIFTTKTSFICKGKKLYGEDLDSILSLFFGYDMTNNDVVRDKQIDFTVWNSSLSGENGLVSALQYAKADKILYLSLVKAENGCAAQKGPAVVFKDGNYVLPLDARKQFEAFASREKMELQSFVGKTNRAMEQLDVHSAGKPLLGIYLPVEHENTRMEEIFLSDIEKTRNVLLKYVLSL